MKSNKEKSLEVVLPHWRNFIFVVFGLLLVGIIIGFVLTPTL